MILHLFQRLVLLVPTLLGVTLLTFLLLHLAPGDPAISLLGERASAEALQQIREAIGEDETFLRQYTGYLHLLVRGELGQSYYTHRPILQDLIEKFPNTLELAIAAMLLASIAAIILGTWMAIRQNQWADRILSILCMAGLSFPVFWIGLMLMLVFSFLLHLLPPSGMGGGSLWYLVLPSATLAIPSACLLARLTRASVLEVLSQPFITSVRSRGLPASRVVFKHVLKNALIPVLTMAGLDFASYLNGAVLTETIFGWDGVGRYALNGILKRDYPVVMGVVLLGALIFVLINLTVDLLYRTIDPRIRINPRDR